MSKLLIKEIFALAKDGWRPYNLQPEEFVYRNLACKVFARGRKPSWFVKADMFLCVSCSRRCSLFRPSGFQQVLPICYRDRGDHEFTLTPEEMMTRKASLTVAEAAYCLNVSQRKVYNWLDEGRLVALRQRPKRVRVDEVREMMQDFDD